MPHDPTAPVTHPTGKEIPPRETVPQGTVKPGAPTEEAYGPRDWSDVVTHTGEARGVLDTAYSTLQPDAPTVGAAERGHEVDQDSASVMATASSTRAPD